LSVELNQISPVAAPAGLEDFTGIFKLALLSIETTLFVESTVINVVEPVAVVKTPLSYESFIPPSFNTGWKVKLPDNGTI
jgi:hypothetical protein